MNLEKAWARARDKYLRVTGAPAFAALLDEHVAFAPTRHPGFRGHVIDGLRVAAVREINGAVLSDQRVRWKPTPPTYTAADVEAARARRKAAEQMTEWQEVRDPRFDFSRSPFWDHLKTDSRTTSDSRARDFADAAAFAFRAAAQQYDGNERHKQALQRLIATLPKGSKERADAERLLRKIHEQGG
jgi:hypothetical protein